MNVLGKNIKQLRDRADIQQNEFAKKIGVSNVVLSRYESGERKPDYDTLQKIADFFDVSIDYLLGRSDYLSSKQVTIAGQEINLSQEELQLFNELKKHPVMFHDLASDPEKKVKELLKMYKMKQMFLDDEDSGDGFGELED